MNRCLNAETSRWTCKAVLNTCASDQSRSLTGDVFRVGLFGEARYRQAAATGIRPAARSRTTEDFTGDSSRG